MQIKIQRTKNNHSNLQARIKLKDLCHGIRRVIINLQQLRKYGINTKLNN